MLTARLRQDGPGQECRSAGALMDPEGTRAISIRVMDWALASLPPASQARLNVTKVTRTARKPITFVTRSPNVSFAWATKSPARWFPHFTHPRLSMNLRAICYQQRCVITRGSEERERGGVDMEEAGREGRFTPAVNCVRNAERPSQRLGLQLLCLHPLHVAVCSPPPPRNLLPRVSNGPTGSYLNELHPNDLA